MYKIYLQITLLCLPVSALSAYGNVFECEYDEDCSSQDRHALCREKSCICANGTHRDIGHELIKCSTGRLLNETCRSTSECSDVDPRSRCQDGVCRCSPGNHEAVTAIGRRCFPGRVAKPACDVARPCVSHGFVCTPWGICDCRLPGYKAELLFSHWRCIQDPFFFESRNSVTFLKVSPVPLLVVCIMLAYFGYQRKVKSPPAHRTMREVSRLHQRRIVPLWRGVTFRSAPPTATTQAQSHHTVPISPRANRSTSIPAPPPLPPFEIVVPEGHVSPPPPYRAEQDDGPPPSYDEVVRSASTRPPAGHVISVPSEKRL